MVRDAIAEALRVGGKGENAVITTINKEKSESSSSDDFAAEIFERDNEISHLQAENAKLSEENSDLKSANVQLKIENLNLNAEILQLRG